LFFGDERASGGGALFQGAGVKRMIWCGLAALVAVAALSTVPSAASASGSASVGAQKEHDDASRYRRKTEAQSAAAQAPSGEPRMGAAASGTWSDTTGDAHCSGDITTYSASNEDTIVVSNAVKCPTDPRSSPHWNCSVAGGYCGISHIMWDLDVDGDAFEDFTVFSTSSPGWAGGPRCGA
jgi:hypothetical protein